MKKRSATVWIPLCSKPQQCEVTYRYRPMVPVVIDADRYSIGPEEPEEYCIDEIVCDGVVITEIADVEACEAWIIEQLREIEREVA
ncbi:MAG: hypothetical protein MI864_28690 [Pseudomonadales bacterium]|nr:hypothetical protein [Pseudomonadales bacterium]